MLYEIEKPRQIEGEGRRRWFSDDYFDLIVWYDEDDGVSGFQLCYDKSRFERALTWRRKEGFVHERVDDGEVAGRAKMSPVLVPDGAFARDEIAERFRAAGRDVDPEIRALVLERLAEFPG
jgi:hypothetical protein